MMSARDFFTSVPVGNEPVQTLVEHLVLAGEIALGLGKAEKGVERFFDMNMDNMYLAGSTLWDEPMDVSWRHWNGNTAAEMAKTILAEYTWSRLPILADALEEAGCTSDKILTSLRATPLNAFNLAVLYFLADPERFDLLRSLRCQLRRADTVPNHQNCRSGAEPAEAVLPRSPATAWDYAALGYFPPDEEP